MLDRADLGGSVASVIGDGTSGLSMPNTGSPRRPSAASGTSASSIPSSADAISSRSEYVRGNVGAAKSTSRISGVSVSPTSVCPPRSGSLGAPKGSISSRGITAFISFAGGSTGDSGEGAGDGYGDSTAWIPGGARSSGCATSSTFSFSVSIDLCD